MLIIRDRAQLRHAIWCRFIFYSFFYWYSSFLCPRLSFSVLLAVEIDFHIFGTGRHLQVKRHIYASFVSIHEVSGRSLPNAKRIRMMISVSFHLHNVDLLAKTKKRKKPEERARTLTRNVATATSAVLGQIFSKFSRSKWKIIGFVWCQKIYRWIRNREWVAHFLSQCMYYVSNHHRIMIIRFLFHIYKMKLHWIMDCDLGKASMENDAAVRLLLVPTLTSISRYQLVY